MPVLLLLAAVLVLAVVMVPLSLVLRYRAGTARRRARPWLATINTAGFAFSIAMFLAAAAVTSTWAPGAFTYSLAGLGIGILLGLLGQALTRWEVTPQGVFYKPNAALVLTITLVVTARILYGFWRAWQAWGERTGDETWLAGAGIAGSLAAGAVVLGYYFTYWAALRWRVSVGTARPGR